MIVEIANDKYDNWRGFCLFPAVAKIVSKIILEHIKEHLESLIDREQLVSALNPPALITSTPYKSIWNTARSLDLHQFQESFLQREQDVVYI